MKFLKLFLFFLLINFGALALGVLFMGDGATSAWYTSLNKAPWTPPNWAFGTVWTLVMLCFSFYMTWLYRLKSQNKVVILFIIQFILNVLWNYVFFNQHLILSGLLIITGLTAVITIFLFNYFKTMGIKSLLIIPYFIWICIATSLNLYIFLYN